MDGTQWECNSSDTLLNDFFSQDDLKQLAVDAGIMLECPLLVLDDTFHVVAYYYPPGFVDMCMTRQSAILITGSHRERLLRICRTTGYARCVVSEKISFPLKAK